MHDIMKKRLWRKLEALPEQQLYQALDYIEFLETKYARGAASGPGGLQRFAERVEDRMRARSLAPRVMGGAMTLLGTAGRMLDGITQTGRDILGGGSPARPDGARPPAGSGPARHDPPSAASTE